VAAQRCSIAREIRVLRTADKSGNVAIARWPMGFCRETFCQLRRVFKCGGAAIVIESKRGMRGPHSGQFASRADQTSRRVRSVAIAFTRDESPPQTAKAPREESRERRV
jgi:hypothetical protein